MVGGLLLAGVAAGLAARRLSVPILVAFLGLGMLMGSEGLGGIEFDDPELARAVGTIGLVAILYEGGLTSRLADLRPVALSAALLSTAGVAITAALTGLAAYLLFDLSLLASMLLGAVVGSTDAAAVFATLRFTTIRRRLAALLEAESGANDPMAIALTLGLIAWLTEDAYGPDDLLLLLVQQLGIGLAIGAALAFAVTAVLERTRLELGPFAPVLSLAVAALTFGVTQVAGGSGFLAVYVVGLAMGSLRSPILRDLLPFHQGLAFLAQIALFVVLGLLVFPSELGPVIGAGLALTAALTFVARPLAVWLCTLYPRYDRRSRLLLSWAGLRGAVPIVLATFALSEGVADSDTIFNAVFFVVIVSALLQGLTLEPAARRLGLTTEPRPLFEPPLEVAAIRRLGADLLEYTVRPCDATAGRRLRDLELPREAVVAIIVRSGRAIPPRGSTTVEPGDVLYVVARGEQRETLRRILETGRGA